jgi:hypothetical protein
MSTIQPWASTAAGQRREAGEKEAASRRTADAHVLEEARTINGLLGVISRHFGMFDQCPLFSQIASEKEY